MKNRIRLYKEYFFLFWEIHRSYLNLLVCIGNKYNFANKCIYIVEADEAKNLQNKKQIKQNNNSQHYLEMLMDQISWDRKSRCVL